MNKLELLAFALGLGLVGCVSTEAVKKAAVIEAAQTEAVNVVSATCGSLGVTKDCDFNEGANRLIELEQRRMRVAGNDKGDVVLIMQDQAECPISDSLKWCGTFVNNRNFRLMKDFLASRGVGIISVQALAFQTTISGYLLTLDKDGYSLVVEKSLPPQ